MTSHILESIMDVITFIYNNTKEPNSGNDTFWRCLWWKAYTAPINPPSIITQHTENWQELTHFDREDMILRKGVMSRLSLQPVPSWYPSQPFPTQCPLIHNLYSLVPSLSLMYSNCILSLPLSLQKPYLCYTSNGNGHLCFLSVILVLFLPWLTNTSNHQTWLPQSTPSSIWMEYIYTAHICRM